jgi:hypothetical protein
MTREQEKIAYLREVVSFDMVMLNYAFMRLLTLRRSTSEEELDLHAYLDSFALHVRNLVRFLCGKSTGSDRNAADFIPDFQPPNHDCLQRPLLRLEHQMLNAALSTTDLRERFDVADARALYAWIVPAILAFQEQLNPPYRASLGALGQTAPETRGDGETDRSG